MALGEGLSQSQLSANELTPTDLAQSALLQTAQPGWERFTIKARQNNAPGASANGPTLCNPPPVLGPINAMASAPNEQRRP